MNSNAIHLLSWACMGKDEMYSRSGSVNVSTANKREIGAINLSLLFSVNQWNQTLTSSHRMSFAVGTEKLLCLELQRESYWFTLEQIEINQCCWIYSGCSSCFN